jgi:hypothetical protein
MSSKQPQKFLKNETIHQTISRINKQTIKCISHEKIKNNIVHDNFTLAQIYNNDASQNKNISNNNLIFTKNQNNDENYNKCEIYNQQILPKTICDNNHCGLCDDTISSKTTICNNTHCRLCDDTISSKTTISDNNHCGLCDDTISSKTSICNNDKNVFDEQQSLLFIKIMSNLEERLENLEKRKKRG